MLVGIAQGLVQSVGAIVIGHFSMDGKLKADHFNFTSAIRNMFIIDAPIEVGCSRSVPVALLQDVIEKFSYSGHMVLSAMTNGMV